MQLLTVIHFLFRCFAQFMFACDVLETKILDLGIVPLSKIYFKMIQMEKEKWFCSALVCPRTSTNKRSKRTRVHPYQNNVKRKRNLKKLILWRYYLSLYVVNTKQSRAFPLTLEGHQAQPVCCKLPINKLYYKSEQSFLCVKQCHSSSFKQNSLVNSFVDFISRPMYLQQYHHKHPILLHLCHQGSLYICDSGK